MIFSEDESPIKVSINQFYGIEINDFAVSVAKTALWIAEHQMMKETRDILHDFSSDFLPLKTYANIVEANALKIDWREVIKPEELNYIMGNPPFRGYSLQTQEQKEEILKVYSDESGKPYKSAGKIDYVAAWYFKAAEFMQETNIKAAFVSTNSITQGEQVSAVWKPLIERFNIKINFAWRTFKWNSESSDMAQVHVVIIGFGNLNDKTARIYDGERIYEVNNINPYLIDAENIFIDARSNPLCDVPIMMRGSQPTDGGNLILTEQERDELLQHEPQAQNFIRPFMMGKDFIDRKPRYCLWLVDIKPEELNKMPLVRKRVEAVKEFRLASKKQATQRKADTPTLFDERIESPTDYVAVPNTSSENRFYIPMGWLNKSVIPGNELRIIPDANLYHFGVLTSRIHMAWLRVTCGRLEMRYRYTNTIVYNNFPWPSPSDKQRVKIEQTAQKILDARALYPESSLADLYNDVTMPVELRKAHKLNDAAVCEAYNFDKDISEADIVSNLMRMYQELTLK
ncbi:MAG: hypothetical protein IJP88_06145 [Synergistaceae bacterium]|nr:hypothetical protein [Synergistaceae bacterium]